jgi:hypothetical protein
MSDTKLELVNLYKEYIEYLEKRIDEAVESKEYASTLDYADYCIRQLLPREEHHSFGPIEWTTIKYCKPSQARYWMDELIDTERQQHEIVDRYSPTPSFEGFVEWLSSPKKELNKEVVEKLRSIRRSNAQDWAIEHGFPL